MIDLDSRLGAAAEDLWQHVGDVDVDPTSVAARRRVPLRNSAIAIGLCGLVGGAIVFDQATPSGGGTSSEVFVADPNALFAGSPSASYTDALAAAALAGITYPFDPELERDVVAAATTLGWSIDLASNRPSSVVRTLAPGVVAIDAHFEFAGDVSGIQVGISYGSADAVKQGSENRGDPLSTNGAAQIFVGTDSPQARAVELFDGLTIVYVRSEPSGGEARSLDELSTLAIAINRGFNERFGSLPPDGVALALGVGALETEIREAQQTESVAPPWTSAAVGEPIDAPQFATPLEGVDPNPELLQQMMGTSGDFETQVKRAGTLVSVSELPIGTVSVYDISAAGYSCVLIRETSGELNGTCAGTKSLKAGAHTMNSRRGADRPYVMGMLPPNGGYHAKEGNHVVRPDSSGVWYLFLSPGHGDLTVVSPQGTYEIGAQGLDNVAVTPGTTAG
jgi:hypothetical protein